MVKNIFSVVSKTAIVTGASFGLGEEFAQILASRGANVVLAARRTDRLQELAESITRDGGTALPITCDVADSAQVKDMVATAWDRFGREMRTVFAAAAFVVAGVATAQAADIAAKTGYEAKLDADSSRLDSPSASRCRKTRPRALARGRVITGRYPYLLFDHPNPDLRLHVRVQAHGHPVHAE